MTQSVFHLQVNMTQNLKPFGQYTKQNLYLDNDILFNLLKFIVCLVILLIHVGLFYFTRYGFIYLKTNIAHFLNQQILIYLLDNVLHFEVKLIKMAQCFHQFHYFDIYAFYILFGYIFRFHLL